MSGTPNLKLVQAGDDIELINGRAVRPAQQRLHRASPHQALCPSLVRRSRTSTTSYSFAPTATGWCTYGDRCCRWLSWEASFTRRRPGLHECRL